MQRRLVGCTWVMTEAHGSVWHRTGRPSWVLRMSSEVCFTRERGGRHQQAAPVLGGWGKRRPFFFLVPRGPTASSGGAGRWPPLTAHPRSCIQSLEPGSTEPLIRPQVGPHQAWPCAAPRAFVVCRSRPAPRGFTCCRRRLCPDTGGQPLLPEAPAATPRLCVSGRVGQEATARRNQPRRGLGVQQAAAEGAPAAGEGPGIR